MKMLRSALSALAVCAMFLHGCAGETTGPNRRPVAQAGSDRVVALLEPAVLDAGSSFDPDGDVLTYRWDLVAAPPGGTATVIKPTRATAGLAPDAPGVWVVRLTVSDGQLSSEPDVIRMLAGGQDHPHSTVCEGDTLVVYDWEGQEVSREHCGLGCNAAADPDRCNLPGTSNIDPELLCANDHDLVIDSPAAIDTTAGTITGVDPGLVVFHEFSQGAGLPSIGVFVFNQIDIRADLTVRGNNALALVACGDMEIRAVIDASASGRTGGPGGFDGGEAGSDGQGPGPGRAAENGSNACPTLCAAGGGGGGHGGRGGSGGELDCRLQYGAVDLAPGASGQANGAAELVPLAGGSGGAGGTLVPDDLGNSPGAGGGGGGAVQLTAGGHIRIGSPGGVTVAGEGGSQTLEGGGAGGGAGGAILVEAASIEIGTGAFLAANGGGGGGGDCLTKNDDVGLAGEKGTNDLSLAEGGKGAYPTQSENAGDGGRGGAGEYIHGETGDEDTEDWEGGASGGGGGGAGRIRLNTPDSNVTIHGVVSPDDSAVLTLGRMEVR